MEAINEAPQVCAEDEIDGDDRAFEFDPLQELEDGGNLVAFTVYRLLREEKGDLVAWVDTR